MNEYEEIMKNMRKDIFKGTVFRKNRLGGYTLAYK
jgi:hypothetical protein